jgi:amino acid carrier protein
MDILTITSWINGYMWGTMMVALCMGVALYYSVILRFPQIRHIGCMLACLKGGASQSGLSPFQAFAMALGGRIGIGTIAGVATGIYFGGPGAVFWMWVYAILGAATAFGESVLAQIWKEDINGEYKGGPGYYLAKTPFPILSFLFVIPSVFAFTGPTIQAHSIAEAFNVAFGMDKTVTGIVLAVAFGIIMLGGMKRIGQCAEYVVPFMAGAYIVVTVVVLVMNLTSIPAMFALIIKSAFGLEAAYGGIVGSAVMWGIRRSVYSSEAGMGSGAHAAASSEVSHPVKQGMVQAFSVYSTLIVCTATALMILVTGAYNVTDGVQDVFAGLPGIEAGVGYTQAAIDTVSPRQGVGAVFVALAILFFAFTTIMSFGFYGAVNVTYLLKRSRWLKIGLAALTLGQMFSIIFGSANTAVVAWNIADMGVGMGVWINLIGMIFLAKPVVIALRDFERQQALGRDPVFEPRALGIEGADLWEKIVAERYREASDGES